jgi:hypothetical protein
MMSLKRWFIPLLAGALVLTAGWGGVRAEHNSGSDKSLVSCEMTFDLKGWSAFYKSSKGDATISCDNGQSANARIVAKGGGLTFGKSEVINGTGKFSGARNIDELFGSYAQAEAHAGAGKSVAAQALTKGEISLVLSGSGRGVDVGFAFGKFTLKRSSEANASSHGSSSK